MIQRWFWKAVEWPPLVWTARVAAGYMGMVVLVTSMTLN